MQYHGRVSLEEDLKQLANPKNVTFKDAVQIAERYFGAPRTAGSHHIFKMPWAGDPRINLQKDGKMAKPYQIRQLTKALEKLKEVQNEKPGR
jgi:hypothetical protein